MMKKKQMLCYNLGQRRLSLKGEPRKSEFEPSYTREEKNEHTLLGARVVRAFNFYYVFTTFGVHDIPIYAKIGCYCVDIKIKNKCWKPV